MSSTPRRIRRERKKGWRKPPNCVIVDRTSRSWGNPFKVHRFSGWNVNGPDCSCHRIHDRRTAASIAVALYRDHIERALRNPKALYVFFSHLSLKRYPCTLPASVEEWLAPLRDRDLACTCKLCEKHAAAGGLPLGEQCEDCDPCHADVVLAMANPSLD